MMSEWLRSRMDARALSSLKGVDHEAWCDDDLDWLCLLESYLELPLKITKRELVVSLGQMTVRTYHGCRTEDAGHYFGQGLRGHRRVELEAEVRSFLERTEELGWWLSGLTQRIAEVESNIDEGCCYVVLDPRPLLERAAHYLIYGSEWRLAVLGNIGRRAIRQIGAPTLLEIDLPLRMVDPHFRENLAKELLQEWTRQFVSQTSRVRWIDFTFKVRQDIPPEHIVAHSHPEALRDPLDQFRTHRSTRVDCVLCRR